MDVFFTFPHNLWLLLVLPSITGLAHGMDHMFMLKQEYDLIDYDIVAMLILHIVLSYAIWNMFSSNIIVLFIIISVGLIFTAELYDILLDHNIMFRF